MPARKRLKVALAGASGVALLAGAALLGARGHPLAGAVLAVATLGAAALALHVLWVPLDVSGRSLRRGGRSRAEVALTFDDGPGPDTAAILDALDGAGVQATFFVLGEAAAQRPEVVRAIAARGHLVALHGHTHRKLALAAPSTVAREIDRGREAIRAAGVEPAPFFRAPHGFKGPVLARALRRRGLTLVGWTRGVWDTERPGAGAIADRACERMRGGEILLLHDGCGTPGVDPRRDQTAAAVPEIARRWREAGFRFVTVEALEKARPRAGTPPWIRLLGLVAVAALAIFALRRLDPHELRRALATASLPLLLAAAAVNLGALAFQAGRWQALVRPLYRMRFLDGFFSLVAGYAIGLAMPARASDLARVHLAARRSGASMASLAATAAMDHLMGSATLLVTLGLAPLVFPLPPWAHHAGKIALGVAVAGALAVWLLRPGRDAPPEGGGLAKTFARLRHGLKAVRDPKALLLSAAAAFGGWAAEIGIALVCLAAFGLPATVEAALLVVVATSISAAVSVSPGNAGAFELATVLALGGLGVSREPAVVFAIGYHLVHLVPVAVVGGGWLLLSGYRGGLVREVP